MSKQSSSTLYLEWVLNLIYCSSGLCSFLMLAFSPFSLFSLQCSNGHTLCSGCKPRVHNRCPTCRHELGNIRCLALEKVAASLELPCKYQSYGCMGIYPYYSKLKHESQCIFRPYNCPYAGSECTVMGDIPYLVAHLKDDHKVDMHNGSTFNHRYVKQNPHEVENATWMLTVLLRFLCLNFLLFYSREELTFTCLVTYRWFFANLVTSLQGYSILVESELFCILKKYNLFVVDFFAS